MKKKSQKIIIKNRLIKKLPVSNIDAINGVYGSPILRLSGIIHTLRKEMDIKTIPVKNKLNKAITAKYIKV